MFRNALLLGAAIAMLALAACSGVEADSVPLPDNVPWYNVSRPLTWQDLRGRVVLLDFFTPGCINCVHMLPVEEKLAEEFGRRLVVIGVDSPKFTNSATRQGLVDFIEQFDIHHPVLLDAQMKLWRAWGVRAWPTLILVGPKGKPQASFIGEQGFSDFARAIRAALAEAPPAKTLAPLPLAVMDTGGAMLDAPGGIAVAGDTVAISDTGHNRLVLATRDGEVTAVIGGCGKQTFERPHGLDFHAGKLYVADTGGQRIRIIDMEMHEVTTLVGSGERAFLIRGEFPARQAELNSPWDIQWLGGKLYVAMAGNHQIWRYDPASGRIRPWAGSGREGLRDGTHESAEFAQPSGLAAHEGTLYVADAESSAIRAIASDSGRVETLVGQGLFKFGLVDGPAEQALLQHPEGVVWLDRALYIADTFNNAVRVLKPAANQVDTVAKGLAQPQALAVLDQDTLLAAVAGENRIVAVHLPAGRTEPWTLEGLGEQTCTRESNGQEVAHEEKADFYSLIAVLAYTDRYLGQSPIQPAGGVWGQFFG